VRAFRPLRTLDGPELPLTVEQPSFGKTARTGEDQLARGNLRTSRRAGFWRRLLSNGPRPILSSSRRGGTWGRAALLGTLTAAAIVIAWIEVIHQVCL
jgi:hypothetical protein